jgi:transcription-repair coupling factor (superfamily II helicase)
VILSGLNSELLRAPTFENAVSSASRNADFSLVEGLRAPLLAALLAARAGQRPAPQALLAIVATGRDSESLRAALGSVMPDADVVEFPAWETLPHERLSPSAETVGKRIHALRIMQRWQEHPERDLVIVASVRAALQPLSDNLTSIEPLALTAGGRGYNLADISRRLVDLA